MSLRIWIGLAMIVATFASGFYLGGIQARGAAAARERDQMAKQLDDVLRGQAEDKKRAENLQRTLDALPRSQGVIREVVHDNPSGCVLPPAVVDSLREAIRKGNAARALPTDP